MEKAGSMPELIGNLSPNQKQQKAVYPRKFGFINI